MSGLTRCLAAATAALLAVGAAPAEAAFAAPADAVVHGTVTSGGHPLSGVRVGTWNPSRGAIATTVTDSHGAFTLRSPSSVPVDVWAGAAPTSARAVFRLGDQHLVRGVVGRAAPRGTADPLWQRVDPALPGRLNRGHGVDLRLRAAGRFTSSTAQGGDGGVELVRGADDSDRFDAQQGRIDSGWLVPGTYRLRWTPGTGRLPVTTSLRLGSGSTEITAPTLPMGTTVRLRATSGGRQVVSGVHAVEVVGHDDQDAGATDSSGVITLQGVAPGRHTWIVGRGAVGPDGAPEVPLTDDRYLPATVTLDVARGQADASTTVELRPAGRILGHVTQPAHHAVLVVAEDAAGTPVRVAAASKGAYELGGLPGGTYRLVAEDRRLGTYSDRRVDVPVAGGDVEQALLTPRLREPVLTGRLADAGTVLLHSAVDLRVFRRESSSDQTGRFRVRIFPGRFTPVTFVDGRIQAVDAPITVDASAVVHLASGSRPAAIRGRGRIHGGTVPVTPTLSGPRTVNEEFGGAAPFADVYSTDAQGTAFVGTHLPAGRYRIDGLDGSLPVLDGPWHYDVQRKAFRLVADRTTDIGDVQLSIAD